MSGQVIAGIGCRRDCPSAEILQVIGEACTLAGRTPTALAAPVFKSDEAGLRQAAHALGLPLLLIERAALTGMQGRCLTRSDTAARATGFASVAEACALAAAGDGATLLLARVAGPRATCALAEVAR